MTSVEDDTVQPTLIEMLEAPEGYYDGPTLRREAAVALREAGFKASADADALRAEVKRLEDGISAIRQYGSDTLGGPTKDADDTRDWQRAAVIEVTERCKLLMSGYHWDAADEGDTPQNRAALAGETP
jgi:hypothetical protein